MVSSITKPVVEYRKGCSYIRGIGQCAIVRPINHPSPFVSNEKDVITSRVVKITDEGFETENTIYKAV